jgi:hypothetical protein
VSAAPQTPEPEPAGSLGLLKNERFVRYGWAKFLQLLAQNALIYGLFISVINQQESSLATSAFVLASVVPSILLSVPGGLFADLLPNKFALLSTMIARLVIVYLFIDFEPGLEAIIGLTFLVWGVYQFFSPAENAAVLAIVPADRLPSASSFVQAISLLAQMGGAGIVAPLAIRFLDAEGLYLIVFGLLLVSTTLFAIVPDLSTEQEKQAETLSPWRALPVGYRTIVGDARLTSITLMRVLLDAAMLSFIVVAPKFIEDTLNTGAQNAIYIAVPGAIGLAAGLIIAPGLLTFMSARGVVLMGFLTFTAVLLVLPFVDTLAPDIARTLGPFRDVQRAVNLSDALTATMLLLPLGGLGASFVQVAARTEVYRRAPGSVIAQVFATQSALGSIAALVPTFMVGVALDLISVKIVLLMIGGSLAVLAVAVWLRGRKSQAPLQPASSP